MDEKLRKFIIERSELYKNDMVNFLRDLIGIYSPSCQEGKLVKRIRTEMEKIGYDEIIVDDMGSIIGRIGHGPVKILYDSHIDTVGVNEPEKWPFDPFEGLERDNVIYGRGASDNKGATAAMVYAGKVLKDILQNYPEYGKDKSFYIVGTVQEEDCDGLAMRYILENVLSGVSCVLLGECTDLAIYRGHRGRLEMKIVTQGKPCHASEPERGVNAVYAIAPIIQGIEKLHSCLKDDSFLGKGSIAVTKIDCRTDSLNCVPYECTIYLDRRLTAGETKESALQEIREIIPDGTDYILQILTYETPSYTGKVIKTEKYYPTWVLEEEHRLIGEAARAYQEIFKKTPQTGKWIFSTNGIASRGQLGIPTFGLGPSREVYAHTFEDQCPIEDLVQSCQYYAAFGLLYKDK